MTNKPKTITVTKGSFKNESVINHVLTKTREEDEHKNTNIDKSRTNKNIELRVKDVRDAINESFSDAVENYNNNQSDKRRRIDKMSDKVFSNNNAKAIHGFIFGFGSAADLNDTNTYNRDNIDIDGDEWNARVSALIDFDSKLDTLLNHFNVYTSVLHVDEDNPHLHVFVVPVAETPNSKMKKAFNFNKALIQSAVDCNVDLETTKNNTYSVADAMKRFVQGKLVDEMKESYERVNNTTIVLDKKTKHSKLHIEEYKKAIEPINDLCNTLIDSLSDVVRMQQQLKEQIDKIEKSKRKQLNDIVNSIDIDTILDNVKSKIDADGLDDFVKLDLSDIEEQLNM